MIENLQESLDFYIKLCEDTSSRLDKYRLESEELRAKVIELQQEVSRNSCYKHPCSDRIWSDSKENIKNGTKGSKKVEKA